jgi:hypothetical protein
LPEEVPLPPPPPPTQTTETLVTPAGAVHEYVPGVVNTVSPVSGAGAGPVINSPACINNPFVNVTIVLCPFIHTIYVNPNDFNNIRI